MRNCFETPRRVALLVLSIGVLLRVALALVNTDANDNHLELIKMMAYENRVPTLKEDREAFQPKLYHGTVALFLKAVPRHAKWIQVRVAQLLGCLAGVMTLCLAYGFLFDEIDVSDKVRLLAFSLVALNPVLIGINAQATNDSFVILFGTIAFFFGWRFFQRYKVSDFTWMLIATVGATLTKGNGLVMFVVIVSVFAIALVRPAADQNPPRNRLAMCSAVFLVCYGSLVLALGPYLENYRQAGSLFATNADPAFAVPEVAGKGSNLDLGRASLAEGLLTFRFVDLLMFPQRVNRRDVLLEGEKYPAHQLSAWTQLYARGHFAHFDAWPPSWKAPIHERPWGTWARSLVLNLGRLILLIAIFPTVILVVGLVRTVAAAVRSLVHHRGGFMPLTDWLSLIAAMGYLLFLIALFVKYRDAGWFKSIYIFPAILGFVAIFARECDRLYAWCKAKSSLALGCDSIFAVLLCLYAIDSILLLGQLSFAVAYQLYKLYA